MSQLESSVSSWNCPLCGRTEADIGVHPLPIRQRAHFLANRLTGRKKRYGGAKNPFSAAEWMKVVEMFGAFFELPATVPMPRMKAIISDKSVDLCGECHEEILSEPLYLPVVVGLRAAHFKGRTRIEKIALLASAIKLGVEQLSRAVSNDPALATDVSLLVRSLMKNE
jgi:hypothetical protein